MVQWTAEKDQIILKGIFKFHDIKSSAPLLQYLSEQIGEGCTPKAVSHRLNNIRTTGKPLNKASTPGVKAVAAPKTPTSAGKKTTPAKNRNKKAVTLSESESGPDNDLGEADEPPSSPISNRKRARSTPRKNYAESDAASDESDSDEYAPEVKRIKEEPVEVQVDLGLVTHDVPEVEVEV